MFSLRSGSGGLSTAPQATTNAHDTPSAVRLMREAYRHSVAVVVRAGVIRIRLVVARLPDPFVAVPLPFALDPVVAIHRRVILDDDLRAIPVVIVTMMDDRALHVDRPTVVVVAAAVVVPAFTTPLVVLAPVLGPRYVHATAPRPMITRH